MEDKGIERNNYGKDGISKVIEKQMGLHKDFDSAMK